MSTKVASGRSSAPARSHQAVERPVPVDAIDHVVRQIVERFQPRQVILFGSYAYGEPRPGSDVDMLVVMDAPGKEAEAAVRVCQTIDYHFGLDLIVRSPQKLTERLALGDPFLREIVSRGKVLYDAAGL
jgi:predicted nucleotidyltransferase